MHEADGEVSTCAFVEFSLPWALHPHSSANGSDKHELVHCSPSIIARKESRVIQQKESPMRILFPWSINNSNPPQEVVPFKEWDKQHRMMEERAKRARKKAKKAKEDCRREDCQVARAGGGGGEQCQQRRRQQHQLR